nr:uncharacterized protein LOC103436148 isoform X3 [Malus domestica]XP_028947537.1 uncharacterized protein LOC103436148 isoform X3 [Malus domestica]
MVEKDGSAKGIVFSQFTSFLHISRWVSRFNSPPKTESPCVKREGKEGLAFGRRRLSCCCYCYCYCCCSKNGLQQRQGLGETFGRVTIEAMAFGLPVLGTEAGGTKEIVEHNVTGLLHPVGHDGTRGLAENLRFLLKIRGRCIEGGSDAPEGRRRADEGAAEGPGRGDEDMCREGARTCTSYTDVRPPNLATSISSCFTFDLRAISPCQYPIA